MENDKQQIDENPNDISKTLHKNSFFNLSTIGVKKLHLNAPFPTELQSEELVNLYPDPSLGFLPGFEIRDDGVYCINEDVVKNQSGIYSDLCKQFTKGIFKSGPISISLPIRIFEPRSMLERYTDWFSFAPIILKKAGSLKDKIEAFKQVIIFTLSAMYISTSQTKPFNPLLGETYQATYCDGTEIYMEHTSHTPCVSNIFIKDIEGLYRLSGYFDIFMEGHMKLLFTNYLYCVPKTKMEVYLKGTGQRIQYHYPKLKLGGMIFGKRYVLWEGHMKFEDRENNLRATIAFNKEHPSLKKKSFDHIYGQIFYYDYSKAKKKDFYEKEIPKSGWATDPKLIYSEVTGSWLDTIYFDNQEYWSIKDNYPPQMYPSERNVAPSDARYREDLVWLKKAQVRGGDKLYTDYAQQWKVALEVQQRLDRTHRKK